MRLSRNRHFPLVAFGLAMCCVLDAPARASIVVLRTSGEAVSKRYPVGSVIERGAIRLGGGESLTVIDNGTMRRLNGPAVISATAAPPKQKTVLARLGKAIAQVERRKVKLGVSRGDARSGALPPDIWVLDTGRSGNFCSIGPDPLRLWRADRSRPRSVGLQDLATKSTRSVAWNADQSITAWPGALPFRDRSSYAVNDPRSGTRQFRILSISPRKGFVAGLLALAESGCDHQFDWASRGVPLLTSDPR